MIIVELVTRDQDRYCGACAAHRKSNYESLTFYRLRYGIDKRQTTIVTFCENCLATLHAQTAQK